AFEERLAQEPALRAALARERELRAALGATFDPVLDEPVPQRLQERLRAAPVVSLAEQRVRRRPSWGQWGGMAASLLLGLLIGTQWPSGGAAGLMAQGRDGGLLARGELALALDQRLSGQQQDGVTPGLSFVAQDGRYCRSFSLEGSAGLACRDETRQQWRVEQLLRSSGTGAAPGYRTAATALPPGLLQTIDAMREGEVLDAAAERAARERGWQR
ncbi:MAG TPA: hypothetical protein VJN44_00810, partial [Roseateles sp.]|nr:hypothetical protein [Roseateles sp.]